jgi:hypothetical protein
MRKLITDLLITLRLRGLFFMPVLLSLCSRIILSLVSSDQGVPEANDCALLFTFGHGSKDTLGIK